MEQEYRLILLGFGNVGRAFARLLLDKRMYLQEKYNISWRVVGIATGRHGTALSREGIDLESALQIVGDDRDLSSLSKVPPPENALDFIHKSDADVLFENTPVHYEDGQPATDHLRAALSRDMHAITANKGPVVHAYRDLTGLANTKNRAFLFESAVMDGAPVFSLWREVLPGARLISFRGVLNSTTNLILSLMEDGKSFEQALTHAQEIGIAETDPSGDLDGWDAAIKVSALVTVLMGHPVRPTQVEREGIRGLSKEIVARSWQEGKRWKLLCEARRDGDRITASVHPEEIGIHDPLFNVMGTSSAVTFQSDVLGALTIKEEDPGPHTTAYGLLADFLNAVRR
jgi:homoserine dehydrogenase